MELAERIRAKRIALGMEQADLAKKAGCSAGLIGQYECGILPKNLSGGKFALVKRILGIRSKRVPVPKRVLKAAKPKEVTSGLVLIHSISVLNKSISALTAAIEAFDKHTKPAAVPVTPASPVVLTNSLDKAKAEDRRYPWQNQKSAQA